MHAADLIGLLGVAAYMSGYFAVQVLGHPPNGRLAIALNVIGPICLLVSLSQQFNLASAIAQTLWLLVTLAGWWRGGRRRRAEAARTDG